MSLNDLLLCYSSFLLVVNDQNSGRLETFDRLKKFDMFDKFDKFTIASTSRQLEDIEAKPKGGY